MTVDRIMDEILKLSIPERKSLISRLRIATDQSEKNELTLERCDELLPIAEKVVGHEQDVDHNTALDVLVRQLVAYKMYTEGFTLQAIGNSMSRTHSSVYVMCHKMKDYFSMPKMFAREVEKYNEFDKLVRELDKQKKK